MSWVRSRALILSLVIASTAMTVVLPRSATADEFAVIPYQAVEDGDLELCLDANGEPKSGEIDLLLLIDDSGSLEAVRQPTDPDKRRFDALRVLLRGLSASSASEEARPVNVAAVTFGAQVSVELGFQPLDLGEGALDPVESGRVRQQEEEPRADAPDQAGGWLAGRQVVHDTDDVEKPFLDHLHDDLGFGGSSFQASTILA